MDIVRDESDKNIRALREILGSLAPDLADSSGLQLILPRQLGELKKPEFINSMSMKIRELCDLQERMKENSSDQESLQARVNEILSRS